MAKRSGQKSKLIHILNYLKKYTDDNHVITTSEIINRLDNEHGIECDRKTIYADIECLKDADYDIEKEATRNGGGWKLLTREFEFYEIKLLVDAIQSSKFITPKKSKELINKLGLLVSDHQAKELNRQVVVSSRNKAENESIFYNVDAIYRAFQENKQIELTYKEWNLRKELVTKGDERRVLNPWALIWYDENYYLLAYDEASGRGRHFRVDKMDNVEVLKTNRKGGDWYASIDIGSYAESTFGMMGGNVEDVTIELPENLIGVVIDRFGRDISINKVKNDRIKVRLHNVQVSNQFYGWLTGISKDAIIISPKDVREKYVNWLNDLISANKNEG